MPHFDIFYPWLRQAMKKNCQHFGTFVSAWPVFGIDLHIPADNITYVSRKLEVYKFRQLLTDSIQIVSQRTTTAALAVLLWR
jgi:hypothetical protein